MHTSYLSLKTYDQAATISHSQHGQYLWDSGLMPVYLNTLHILHSADTRNKKEEKNDLVLQRVLDVTIIISIKVCGNENKIWHTIRTLNLMVCMV